jgi:type IV pilus assembly protein PilM
MNVIEISGSAIRLVREREGRLVGLDAWPVPPGADPLLALAAAPLPSPLGRVAVILHHDDMLLRTMVQPATTPERLDKLVRFEVASMAAESGDDMTVAWHPVKAAFPDGEMRLLALVAKRRLIERLRQGLAAHGAKLAALLPPALGLFHAWKMQGGEEDGQAVMIDLGGKRAHLAFAQNGELLFLRTQAPGMDELVKSVAERRGVPESESAKIVARLGRGAPEDLRELIAKQAAALGASITAAVRFAKSQLKLEKFDPQVIHLAGAGAQAPGFAEALRERANLPVKLLNPFSGALSALPSEDMDRLSALPSPWTNAIGAALAKGYELDALSDERARTSLYWRTGGALRVAAALTVALLVLGLARRELDIVHASSAIESLEGAKKDGLVPAAEGEIAKLEALKATRERAAAKVAWLDAQRRPGRVAVELLTAISAQQNPETCPVVLTSYQVHPAGDAIQVDVEGYAKSAGKSSTGEVLNEFQQGVLRRYPLIAEVKQLPRPNNLEAQQFHFVFAIKDRPAPK